MLEIDGDAVAHHGLDLSDPPIGLPGMADTHAWLDGGDHGSGAKMVEVTQRITSAPMTQGMSRPMPTEAPLPEARLARLVGLRMCHDLGGVAGTVGNALELLGGAGGEAAEIAMEAATVLRRRVLLWRAVLGGQGEASLETLLGLLAGQLSGGRATAEVAGLDSAWLVEEEVVPVLLAAMLVAGEALPRGGVIRLSGRPGQDLVIMPEGMRAAWPSALLRAVAGGSAAAEPTSREVLSLWLTAMAASTGIRLDLALPPGEGIGPLVLTLPR